MAAQKTRSQRISALSRAFLALLGFVGFAGWLDQAACQLANLSGVPVRIALGALPPIVLPAWHLLLPYVPGCQRLLEGLLQISVSCGQFILTVAGAA
jgi:hypothetical protein